MHRVQPGFIGAQEPVVVLKGREGRLERPDRLPRAAVQRQRPEVPDLSNGLIVGEEKGRVGEQGKSEVKLAFHGQR